MLDNVSKILTGDMLKALCDMGHGESMVIADANFPVGSVNDKIIRCPGVNVSDVLEAIITLFPIDVEYSEKPGVIMELTDNDKKKGMKTPEAWGDYERIISKRYKNFKLSNVKREHFYELAKESRVVIMTGEDRLYGNLLLFKGCVL